jgi:glycosyltransferase involved in cell wall biosynthesis
MNHSEGVTFVIPCYHESGDIIRKTVAELLNAMKGEIPFEVVLVNDGDRIETFPEFTEAAVITKHHEINCGYGASLMTGIDAARYDWIGIVDADGTYPIGHFKRFLEFTGKYDMVVGCRRLQDLPFMRRLPKYLLLKLAAYISDHHIPDLNSGMRLFRRNIVMNYRRLFPKRFSFTTTITMICFTNFYSVRFLDIPYYTRIGPSAINPVGDTVKFFSLVLRLALYFKPLRFFIPLSMLTFGAASARAIRDILAVNHFGGLTLVLFFMAFQIFFFGLLAEIINKK